MAAKKTVSKTSTKPGPDELVEGQIWWASGKAGIVSPKHYFSSIQIHGVDGSYCRLSLSIMGDSCGIIGVKKDHVLGLRDKLLGMKL